MGLFECYAPQIDNLFWFHPDNLHRDQDPSTERGTALELVPKRYRAMTQYEANQYEV